MFADYAKIIIKSGDGGNGAITFRREKYIAARWTRWAEMVEKAEMCISQLMQILIL